MASESRLMWGVVTTLIEGDYLFPDMIYKTKKEAQSHVHTVMNSRQRLVRVRITWADLPKRKKR